ncbi:hypothetical protein HNQ65_005187, partial [Prosthecobacter vanneervenii]|nr:hypothetical protein [Prosthecobacter vanneervenii]
ALRRTHSSALNHSPAPAYDDFLLDRLFQRRVHIIDNLILTSGFPLGRHSVAHYRKDASHSQTPKAKALQHQPPALPAASFIKSAIGDNHDKPSSHSSSPPPPPLHSSATISPPHHPTITISPHLIAPLRLPPFHFFTLFPLFRPSPPLEPRPNNRQRTISAPAARPLQCGKIKHPIVPQSPSLSPSDCLIV